MIVDPKFIKENVAPQDSYNIGVFDEDGHLVGQVSQGNFKPFYTHDKLYSIGVLADTHNNDDADMKTVNGGEWYTHSQTDLKNALKVFEKMRVKRVVICGDQTQDGSLEDWTQFFNDIQGPLADKVEYVIGNRDLVNESQYSNPSNRVITSYDDNTLASTDVIIFFNMRNAPDGNVPEMPYTDEDLLWLERQLKGFRNYRCFVFTHLFFPYTTDATTLDSGDPAGCGNPLKLYPREQWLRGPQLKKLVEIRNRYKNAIWFTGHSHFTLDCQQYQSNANIWRSPNQGAWVVHVPSCGWPIGIKDEKGPGGFATKVRDDRGDESEGLLVDIYKDYVIIRGISFKGPDDPEIEKKYTSEEIGMFYSNKFLPIATYKLDTTLQKIL